MYGDIGTSPLYAVKETFNPEHGIPLNPANITGGVSTIFWILMIVVSLKYVTLVLRAAGVSALCFFPMARRVQRSPRPTGRCSAHPPLLPPAGAPGWRFPSISSRGPATSPRRCFAGSRRNRPTGLL